MSFDFSTLITDRTQADVTAKNDKGTYNADDLNRVTAAMEYLDDTLRSYGYVTGYQRLEVPHTTTGGGSLLPDGYTELSYIESSGTQYINSNFKANQDTRVVIDFEYISGDVVFGAYDDAGANGFGLQAASNQWYTYYGTSSAYSSTAVVANTRLVADVNKNVSTLNGEALRTATANTFSGANPLIISGLYNASAPGFLTALKIHSCQIYDNGTLARDFVPCISDSGAVGLYDIVGEQFYANAGTGVFTAGDVVDTPITGDGSDIEYDTYTWYEYDLPTKDLMASYLANVLGLYEVILSEPELPEIMEKLTYQGANQIEQALVTLNTAIEQIVSGFARSNAFTFWSGNRPFPTAKSDRGRNWAQLDAMETSWSNWQEADWYLLLYGNLKAEGDVV